ncbi:MAG: hypothetical protein ACOYLB_12775 [Phototrophicaceae bacterium]
MPPSSRVWLYIWFGLPLVVLVAVALCLRLLTVDRFLPTLDYGDESNMFLLSLYMRGEDAPMFTEYGAHFQGEWLAGYPPLYPWLSGLEQQLTEHWAGRFVFVSEHIQRMRWLSVGAGVLTVALLYASGWVLAQPLGRAGQAVAGWFVALPWAVSAHVIDVGNLAIPDSLIYPACALAIFGAVMTVRRKQVLWLSLSLIGCIVAIYLKYSLVFTLWLPLCAMIWLIREQGIRLWWGWLLGVGAIPLMSAAYLIFGYGALGLENKEAAGFREQGLSNMLNLDRLFTNALVAPQYVLGLTVAGGMLTLGIVAWVWVRRQAKPSLTPAWLVMFLPYIVGNTLLTSSVVYANPERGGYARIRYMFPSSLVIVLVLATLLAHWAVIIPRRNRRQRGLMLGACLTLSVAISLPHLSDTLQRAQRFALITANEALWTWADATLPVEGKVMFPSESELYHTWNRPYSGYNGQKAFDWVYDDQPHLLNPQAVFAQGVAYLAFDAEDLMEVYADEDTRTFIDGLFPLKTLSEQIADNRTVYVYRMIPPQHTHDALFGEQIAMIGYDLSVGEEVRFRPYWRAVQPPTQNYSMFVHLVSADAPHTLLAQFDGTPADAQRLTKTWTDHTEQFIGSEVILPLANTAGGVELWVGLYNFETGERLYTQTGEDAVRFAVEVDPVH